MVDHDVNACPKCRVLLVVYDPVANSEEYNRCHDELTEATTKALTKLENRWNEELHRVAQLEADLRRLGWGDET